MKTQMVWPVIWLLVACGESARERDARRLAREREMTAFIERRLPVVLEESARAAGSPTSGEPSPTVAPRSLRHSTASLERMVRIRQSWWIRGCDPDLSGCKPWRDWPWGDFYIDVRETTVAEYDECVKAGACVAPVSGSECTPSVLTWPRHPQLPMNCVTIDEALRYCRFRGKRLPASNEWERAAHGVDGRLFPWGDARPSCQTTVGRARGCRYRLPQAGGSRPADRSPDGVLDSAGNVAEFVASRDPDNPWPPLYQEIRGGSFLDVLDGRGRPKTRPGFLPWKSAFTTEREFRSPAVGFRCAVSTCPKPLPPDDLWRFFEPCVPVDAPPP